MELIQYEIAHNQSPDGSWPPIAWKKRLEKKKCSESNERSGQVYRTNFCILMLGGSYYRYNYRTR